MWGTVEAALQRWAALRAGMDDWARRWAFALLALALTLVSLGGFPEMLSAARNEGRWGTFTAVHEECTNGGRDCTWYGEFTAEGDADLSSIRLHDVAYNGGEIARAGDTVRLQVVPGTERLYGANAHDWIWWAVIDLVCLTYLVWWFVGRRWRRRATG